MITLNSPYLYVKGTCAVNVSDVATGNVIFSSSKIMNNALTTEVDMGAIRAGLGNPIAIQLPSDAAVNLELSTADFNMQGRAMQVGGTTRYNGIRPVCTAITAEGATLSLPDGAEPVANYGYDTPYAYINYSGATDVGTAYEVGADGSIAGFVAQAGTVYNVTYFERQANAQELAISGAFAPGIYHVSTQLAVFSTEGGNTGNRGSQVGWLYIYIPRMQFAGNAETNGNQTDPATTILSGTALSYEEASEGGACTDCSFPMLAYMVYVPFSTSGNGLAGLAVVGGGVTVAANATAVLPVKYVMADNTLVQPNYSRLTYEVAAEATATVAGGVVTGVAAGTTTVTITSQDDPSISTVATITVTA
jgi:hypothetical protein